MPISKTIFRVILSSPSDLAAERRVVHEIINDLNEINKESSFGLQLLTWENDVPPRLSLNNGQTDIDEIFKYDDSDLLIGIFHTKLGTPVLGAESGSIHEINKAIDSYKARKSPEIKLYLKSKYHIRGNISRNAGRI